MNSLKHLIQRCHERHEKPLRQRKTVVTPALYNKGSPYLLTTYCAQRYPVLLADLEQANISFMPIGQAPDNDRGPRTLGGERFLQRQGIRDWEMRRWHASWGIQIYTGIPSELDGARWHDFNFSYKALCDAPDAVLTCLEVLIDAVPNPLLTLSNSGGLRFSCRVPDYLHPNNKEAKYYIYKHASTAENLHKRDVYLRVLGKEGHNRWDARNEILLGNLLEPPIIAKEVVFAPIDALRAVLHEPISEKIKLVELVPVIPLSLGSHNLDLAKEALMDRGFSYLRQENVSHLWRPPNSEIDDRHILLWENEGTVWLRASAPDIGLPTVSTPITDIWDDTGIIALKPLAGMSISNKMLTVQKGKLSPLAIKRPSPMLHKSEQKDKVYETLEKNGVEVQNIFDRTDHIFGLIADTGSEKHYEAVSYVSKGSATCVNMPTYKHAEKLETRYQNRNVPLSKR